MITVLLLLEFIALVQGIELAADFPVALLEVDGRELQMLRHALFQLLRVHLNQQLVLVAHRDYLALLGGVLGIFHRGQVQSRHGSGSLGLHSGRRLCKLGLNNSWLFSDWFGCLGACLRV